MEKQIVRKPLTPIVENDKCKAQYDALLSEFTQLSKLQVKDVDHISSCNADPIASMEEYNTRLAAYNVRRDAYNAEFAGMIETPDVVRKNIVEIKRRLAEPLKMDDFENVLGELVEEQHKFPEIQEAEDAAFAEVAQRTRYQG